jgi:hypothetical protein
MSIVPSCLACCMCTAVATIAEPLPFWVGPRPSIADNTSAGLPLVSGTSHITIYNSTVGGVLPRPAWSVMEGVCHGCDPAADPRCVPKRAAQWKRLKGSFGDLASCESACSSGSSGSSNCTAVSWERQAHPFQCWGYNGPPAPWYCTYSNCSLPNPNCSSAHASFAVRNPFGVYNHGPMITRHSGLYYVSWYNAPGGREWERLGEGGRGTVRARDRAVRSCLTCGVLAISISRV